MATGLQQTATYLRFLSIYYKQLSIYKQNTCQLDSTESQTEVALQMATDFEGFQTRYTITKNSQHKS